MNPSSRKLAISEKKLRGIPRRLRAIQRWPDKLSDCVPVDVWNSNEPYWNWKIPVLSSLVLGRYAIRDVFLDIQLQGRLTSAASFDAELIRNALRLHPTERRDLAIRLLRVKCKTYPVSQDDLDVLFKLYWRGLKAELQRVPRASTSAEQIEAAKFSIVREIYRYLADHPVDLEHFIREEASGREFSYSDISCLVERIIEAAPS
ncbi:MAG: hypothetical protein INH06_13725 [Cupriavidus sp.]|nr:hypothetical protein [Cupriavidus sp.]